MKMKLFCETCKGLFHLECRKVTEIDARLMQQEKRAWYCDNCPDGRRLSLPHRSRTSVMPTCPSPEREDEGIYELKSILKQYQGNETINGVSE
ncbi:unnamed protein product [Ceutorhynchus assimilis]|uniref:PHD-type domain-containing protein n=1 Tax=Ceutorhynchus assimilis TaxID=467358 RepID=A0A9N9QQN4_9CUCU|nr:unnamed protein product [Ceutorhynchus assimilis]